MPAGVVAGPQSPLNPAALAARLAALGWAKNATLLTVSGGTAFAYGQHGYLHTDGSVRRGGISSATIADTAVLCVAAAGVANGASGLFLACPGIVTGLSGGTPGLAFAAADGAIGTARPSVGNFAKIIGRWLSATVLAFDPCPYAQPDEVF